jgi:hypothetical protein
MILGKLELSEQTDMAFSLEVFGTTEQTHMARFVIEGPDFDVSCKCDIANGEVNAKIPKLKGVLPSGVYESRLEIVVGDKIFTPLKEQIELNPLVEFDIKKKKVETVKEGVKVTIKNQVVAEDSKPKTGLSGLDKHIQKAIKDGYEVSQVGENFIMKKGNSYVGIISETTILMAKREYSTLSELIDGLSK